MRIAVWHNLPFGGGSRALSDQVRGLLARGHEVTIWCPPTANRTAFPIPNAVPQHITALPSPYPGDDFPRNRLHLVRRVADELHSADEHARQCAQAIDSGGFDVVLAHTCQFFNVPAIGSFLKTPSVLYLQELSRALHQAGPSLPWLALPRNHDRRLNYLSDHLRDTVRVRGLRLRLRAEDTHVRAFGRVLVNSRFTREAVLRAYGTEAHVCYLGVDMEVFRPLNLTKEHLVVSSAGYLGSHKNLTFLIEAIGLVKPPRPRLVVTSQLADTAYLRHLKAQAASHGVEFETRHDLSDAELNTLINRSKCALYASHLEPFGYGPIEAGACAVPVIAVAEGGLRETVVDGYNGFLVEGPAREMATALARLLDNDELTRSLGQNGREAVTNRWSTEPAVDRLEHHLATLAGLT